MTEKNFPSPILICVAAVALNLFGSFVVRSFNLPLFLDTGGTIFIAMLSGYVPAVAVGFATNLMNSFFDESEMYYCSISIFIALCTTFFARRGFYEKFFKMLLTIPAAALIAAICTMFIEKFLYCTGVVEVFSAIEMHFPMIFLRELADKGLLILLMFFAVKIFPPQLKETFRGLGQRQAPLTTEMRREVYRRKCPRSSLRTKVLLILMLSSLFVAVSVASISYRTFEQAAFHAQIKIAEGLASIAASEIDTAKLDDYLKFGRAAEGYADVEKNFRAILESNPDIKSLSVCAVTAEGLRVIFHTGEPADFYTNFPYGDDLLAGKKIPPIIEDSTLKIYKPIFDGGGKCVSCAAIEVSMDMLSEYGRTFVSKVLALFSGCFVFVFVIGVRFVENNIILPVNTLEYCARSFAYESDEFCADNVEKIKRLKIHTGDEIENLYSALLKTTQDVLDYFEKLRRARRQVAEMDELAHRDSLTGIKNKAAYDERTAELDKKISDGSATFCIAMVDVNYLKRVNDTYGHERGNEYLINASKLTCAVFGAENVYRIGGDEFVVILEDERVSLCKYFVTQFKTEMDRKNSNAALKPWEKISAAVGVARYEAGVDKSSEEVFKRADAQMYENKLAMKAARRD